MCLDHCQLIPWMADSWQANVALSVDNVWPYPLPFRHPPRIYAKIKCLRDLSLLQYLLRITFKVNNLISGIYHSMYKVVYHKMQLDVEVSTPANYSQTNCLNDGKYVPPDLRSSLGCTQSCKKSSILWPGFKLVAAILCEKWIIF